MALYLDKPSATATINNIGQKVEILVETCGEIDKLMVNLGEYWQGEAYNAKKNDYDGTFKPAMTDMNRAAGEFKALLDSCTQKLEELDLQLRG